MIRLDNEFYQACIGMRNQPAPQRFINSLEEYQKVLYDELTKVEEVNDLLRLQGEARILKAILEGYYEADEMKRRIERRDDSGGKGPSKPTIT